MKTHTPEKVVTKENNGDGVYIERKTTTTHTHVIEGFFIQEGRSHEELI